MSHCLIELGTEELPPKALKKLSEAFTQGVCDALKQAGLGYTSVKSFATPRRLAMLLNDIETRQPDQSVEKRGPAVQAAFDADGNPSKAALGFARSCGVDISELSRRDTGKGEWLYFEQTQPGQTLQQLLPDMVSASLAALPIPKRMRWGDRDDEFVRPAHSLVLMLDDEVIPATILGCTAGNNSIGHRFHAPGALEIDNASHYEATLESQGKVIADFDRRRAMIEQQVQERAAALGGSVRIDDDLLDEVTALVEWPVAVSGRFDEAFLDVPSEALVTTMQDNQKYFAVFDDDGHLLPHFITISNIDSSNPQSVISGNERVIRPRFSDAQFFWQQDRKTRLSARLPNLDQVVFQQKLGSIGDKVRRIAGLSGFLAEVLGTPVEEAERAAELCKCDLLTEMVGEFPKLQGIMGAYYARHDGESEIIAAAIEQHYWPRFAGDDVPYEAAGQFVALADRVDTMLGIFAIGQKPSGVKDPFGLRRAALGIIRILIENDLPIDIHMLTAKAAQGLADKVDAEPFADEVIDYIYDRLQAYYRDQNIRQDVVDSVLACKPPVLTDLHNRVTAMGEFLDDEAAVALAAANKRISNILKKNEQVYGFQVDEDLFDSEAEKALFVKLSAYEHISMGNFNGGEYLDGLRVLARLRPLVDRFFDEVMVMVDDEKIRRNRLALLQKLANNFLRVADFSRIQ
jgi:glycyl-tRNA synthetase beta chain